MIHRVLCVLLLAGALVGCAGINKALEYDDVNVQAFDWKDHPWRIFDKPAEMRLMITPSLSRASGQGFVGGLTLGIADTDIPKPEYQSAVEGWLMQTRTCQVRDGYKIISNQWEFTYACR